MGFVEFKEKQIQDMYDLFLTVCKQIREDSYSARQMPPKQQESFVKLYVVFKELVPFMLEKNVVNLMDWDIKKKGKEVTTRENIGKIMDLPHMETLKAELAEKVRKASVTSFPNVNTRMNESTLVS